MADIMSKSRFRTRPSARFGMTEVNRVIEFSLWGGSRSCLSAHSAAVTAAMRRLSAAIQIQTPLGCAGFRLQRELNFRLSRGAYVAGRVFVGSGNLDVTALQRLR